ncbi:carbohydrate-binding protein [Cellulosimicrobium sp. NPDC055967]|uniref:carbohydrate-binding protein n=1 Tax=Cellulosimicrobium sp. NPDC055967 TaxID=3345670 RepID=UPI0035D8AF71
MGAAAIVAPIVVAPSASAHGTGECTAPAWAAGSVYLGGANVSHEGRTYQAKWWTTGENPAQSGQ